MKFIEKLKTTNKIPLKIGPFASLVGFIGGFTVILTLLLLTSLTEQLWIMAPFGASCVLVFGV